MARHLTIEDRDRIAELRHQGNRQNAIAQALQSADHQLSPLVSPTPGVRYAPAEYFDWTPISSATAVHGIHLINDNVEPKKESAFRRVVRFENDFSPPNSLCVELNVATKTTRE